jgi:hypothetical protein
LRFDPAWAAASAAGTTFHYAVDRAFTAVRCTRHNGVVGTEETFLTLRAAEPLPRELPIGTNAAPGGFAELADAPGHLTFLETPSDQTAPSCRFVVDGYGLMDGANPRPARCVVGFLPSTAVATPTRPIRELGGWHMALSCTGISALSDRWMPVAPAPAAAVPVTAGASEGRGWATTQDVPSMPVGGGVEFTVDYAKSSVRAAFYSPQAVSTGFAASPFARMELRMVKPLPCDVALYPAIHLFREGQAIRFA